MLILQRICKLFLQKMLRFHNFQLHEKMLNENAMDPNVYNVFEFDSAKKSQ